MSDHIVAPTRLESEPPRDLTILTVLLSGRHLSYSNIVREGDNPDLMIAAHCAVRRVYHGNVAHFVVLLGADAERVLPEVR